MLVICEGMHESIDAEAILSSVLNGNTTMLLSIQCVIYAMGITQQRDCVF